MERLYDGYSEVPYYDLGNRLEPGLCTSKAVHLSPLFSLSFSPSCLQVYIELKQQLGQHGDLQHLRGLVRQLAGAKEQLQYRAKAVSAER
jgi:hypothetical protein